ncbi:MAG: septum formation protein Maf [Candidatus Xenolissoclinum pacificiensis L6]|uniref:dTTP/UTP pyrophosphatase n=1 Tax=Candidatus Xenolissoclinum pacificiensis L6 TaxID=1401685 RepID=W2V016_9RICK|nr:MAG: septum formation protein Maf [Candidatus Xenolissoclinum pacificiensis L6]
MSFILASSSQRRIDLLRSIGIIPNRIIPPEIDEVPHKNELPKQFVNRMAKEKAQNIYSRYSDSIVVAADTITAVGRRIIPKAHNDNDIHKFIKMLSGRRSKVYTSVCVMYQGCVCLKTTETIIKLKRVTDEELARYITSKEGLGKSAGCNFQGYASRFLIFCSGSYTGLIGLPIYETANLLSSCGVII